MESERAQGSESALTACESQHIDYTLTCKIYHMHAEQYETDTLATSARGAG